MDEDGRGLVFLISQPRSGSTLLQRVLGSHSKVQTLREPWLMLSLLAGFRPRLITAEFDEHLAREAVDEFLVNLPGGEKELNTALRAAAIHLYSRIDREGTWNLFVDKTPRYYLIIPELLRIFPNARIIFLFRNPLAVLASLIEWTAKGQLQKMVSVGRRHDLLSAPNLMIEGLALAGNRGVRVSYEDFVSDPELTAKALCKTLNLDYEPNMLRYQDNPRVKGRLGDNRNIDRFDSPVLDFKDRWMAVLDAEPNAWLARRYLEILGPSTVDAMGYSYSTLHSGLPSRSYRLRPSIVPWDRAILNHPEELTWRERGLVSASRFVSERGVYRGVRRLLRIVIKGR